MAYSGEWLMGRSREIRDMAGVARENALVQLATVPGVHEERDHTPQGLDRAREAPRLTPPT